jgi:hypothetical protein
VERAEVQFGRTTIAFGIRRTSRQKTVSITVEPRGGVLVTAPKGAAQERLKTLVHRKARWIVERQRLVETVEPAVPQREFVTGETFLYLGRQYRLLVERTGSGLVRLERGRFLVPSGKRPRAIRAAMLEWFREHARARVTERLPHWAKRVGVEVTRPIIVTEQRQRWASCDARGVLRFNWRVVQAPMRLVEYVITHELVHLRHPNHTRAFWALLGKAMPDYEERREALRALGPRLGW